SLRVINEDRVIPGAGFPRHGHRDMDILSYVLAGELEHKDSLGNGAVIRPGDVQRMSAGTGILHSEFNPSKSEALHFLQIWLIPDREGLPPSYEQKTFPPEELRGRLRLVAGPRGENGAVTIHQDARLYHCQTRAWRESHAPGRARTRYLGAGRPRHHRARRQGNARGRRCSGGGRAVGEHRRGHYGRSPAVRSLLTA